MLVRHGESAAARLARENDGRFATANLPWHDMDLDRYQRAAKLFEEAMALSPDDRHAHVEHAAEGDEELARRVRRMIGYAERATPTEGFFPNGTRDVSE